jgi:hypothetical protein
MYLEASLSVPKMHRLYLEWMETTNPGKQLATIRQYRDLFSGFNLSFFAPRKDQCNICTAHTNSINSNLTLSDAETQSYEAHRLNRELGRDFKDKDKNRAQVDSSITVACFDFQKILNTPYTEASLAYYKRKLAVYNFTIFDTAPRIGNCYVWDETIANKGANEVCSSLSKFIEKKLDEGCVEFCFYSDNCSGQNRNRFVFGMYARYAKIKKITITHRFLEQGHTQMEADSVHALIEKAKKNVTVFVPQQWYALMSAAKKKGTPYQVYEMDQPDFFDFKDFVERTNWTKNSDSEKIAWSKVKEVTVKATEPNVMLYKLNFLDEDYKRCIMYDISPIMPSTRKRKVIKPFDFCEPLKNAYNGKLPIKTAKYKDLISLCTANIIPSIYHQFFRSLEHLDYIQEDDDNFLDEFFIDV